MERKMYSLDIVSVYSLVLVLVLVLVIVLVLAFSFHRPQNQRLSTSAIEDLLLSPARERAQSKSFITPRIRGLPAEKQ
jgi:hypothetical protein